VDARADGRGAAAGQVARRNRGHSLVLRAEGEGFEPPGRLTAPNGFQDRWLQGTQPLCDAKNANGLEGCAAACAAVSPRRSHMSELYELPFPPVDEPIGSDRETRAADSYAAVHRGERVLLLRDQHPLPSKHDFFAQLVKYRRRKLEQFNIHAIAAGMRRCSSSSAAIARMRASPILIASTSASRSANCGSSCAASGTTGWIGSRPIPRSCPSG